MNNILWPPFEGRNYALWHKLKQDVFDLSVTYSTNPKIINKTDVIPNIMDMNIIGSV